MRQLAVIIYGILINRVKHIVQCSNSHFRFSTTRLSSLQHLSVDSNQLTELPVEMCALLRLEEFHVANNQLTSLPLEFGFLVNLEKLYLQKNKIRELPEVFQNENVIDFHNDYAVFDQNYFPVLCSCIFIQCLIRNCILMLKNSKNVEIYCTYIYLVCMDKNFITGQILVSVHPCLQSLIFCNTLFLNTVYNYLILCRVWENVTS